MRSLGAPPSLTPRPPREASEAAITAVEKKGYRGATIDYVIMIGYFAAIVALGIFFGRKMKSTEDFIDSLDVYSARPTQSKID